MTKQRTRGIGRGEYVGITAGGSDGQLSRSLEQHILTRIPFLSFMCDRLSLGAALVAQMVKHLPAMWGTQVQSLGQEDPLEKEMATHSSTLAWKIPWTEEPCRLQFMGLQRVGHDWVTSLHFFFHHKCDDCLAFLHPDVIRQMLHIEDFIFLFPCFFEE